MKKIFEIGKKLSKQKQLEILGGFDSVPIATTCDFRSLRACQNSCTAPFTECGPCLDNNPIRGTYECRYIGF
ncbi:hypothetical protein [Tenacibaculum jejuense]|uniref:hypothetical protein n=1 Tax=Tenacibaculum jejuense TaxID=584609 RepID=UPI000BA32E94|nr:hypothetical protein [Tenacibaculum jejuense]